jgi:hypothetical protein
VAFIIRMRKPVREDRMKEHTGNRGERRETARGQGEGKKSCT